MRLKINAAVAPKIAAGAGAPGVGRHPPAAAKPPGHRTSGPKFDLRGLGPLGPIVKADAGAADKSKATNAVRKLRVMINQKRVLC